MTDNGLRIPLIIDGAMLVLIIFMAGSAVTRISALADDVAEIKEKELPERVVRIETEVKQIARSVEHNTDLLESNRSLMQEILREVRP